MTDDGSFTGQDVIANQVNPNTNTQGGVAEFQISGNPTIALQPTDSADLPHLVMSLDTRNRKNVNVAYTLRDIDGSSDNAQQQAILQYRVGSSGSYTNLPSGYVSDATTGPNLATKTTSVSVTLPAAADNRSLVQVRVGVSNATASNDEWVGVDDIVVSSVPSVTLTGPAAANEGETKTYDFAVADTDPSDTFSVKSGFPDCGTGGTFVFGSLSTTASGGSFQCRFPDGPAEPVVRMQVADGDGAQSNVATRQTTVNGPPQADDDATTDEDEAVTVDVFANDDPDGDPVQLTGNSQASDGAVECGAEGCTYTPDQDFNGADSFTYRASDGNGGSDTARVTLTVNAVNDAPVIDLNGAAGGTGREITFTEDGDPGSVGGAALTVTDADDANLESATVTVEERLDGDAESLAADTSGTSINASYDAATGELSLEGTDTKADYNQVLRTVTYDNTSQNPSTADRSVSFAANDGTDDSEEATATVSVVAENDAPTISDIPDVTTDEDTATDRLFFTVGDAETAAADLTLAGASSDAELVPEANIEFGGDGAGRTVRVTPAENRFGTAEISVTVSDGSGEDGFDATDTFVLTVRDRTPPDAPRVDLEAASDTGSSDADDVTGDAKPTFAGSAEAGSEVAVYDGTTLLGTTTVGSGPAAAGGPTSGESGDWSITVPEASPLDDGERRISAEATDAAGNTSEASAPLSVTVDTQAPDTQVDVSPRNPTNETTATFFVVSSEQEVGLECSLDDGAFEACETPEEYADLSDGDRSFEVRAIDRAGNVDPSPARRHWTVDTRGPSAELTAPDDGQLVRGEVGFAAEAGDDLALGKVEFLVDDEVVDVDRGGPFVFDWDSVGVDDGEHAISVRATDAAGNQTTSAAHTIRVDNTAPDTVIDSSPNNPTNATTVQFGFSSRGENGAFECSLDDGSFEPCSSPKEYSGLQDGEHLFGVRAVDGAGNRDDTAAERRFVVDAVPLSVVTMSPRGKKVLATSPVSAVFSERMDPATITNATFKLVGKGKKGAVSAAISATVSYDETTNTATLDPRANLKRRTSYTVVVVGGQGGVKDLTGGTLARSKKWTFRVR